MQCLFLDEMKFCPAVNIMLFIQICLLLQQHKRNIGFAQECSVLEFLPTSHVTIIIGHSSIEHLSNFTNTTKASHISETFDKCWIGFCMTNEPETKHFDIWETHLRHSVYSLNFIQSLMQMKTKLFCME